MQISTLFLFVINRQLEDLILFTESLVVVGTFKMEVQLTSSSGVADGNEIEASSRSTASAGERNKGYSQTGRSTLTVDESCDDLEDDIDIEEALDPSSSIQNSSTADESAGPIKHVDQVDINAMARRTKLFGLLVLVLGLSASTVFLYFGLSNAANEADASFETRAKDLALVVETTWHEYERIAASAHEICSRGNGTTRVEFQEFYEYILADGIEFQSIQCVPNVTHADRAAHEKEAKEYWEARVPGFEYPGFTGIFFDSEEGKVTGVESPESERPFYFPIKYCEPPETNLGAIDLDVYLNEEVFQPLLNYCIENQQPVLSARINTVQETEENAYSVLVYHPGVPLSTQPGKIPDMLSSLVVRVPSLLQRVARLQEEDLAVYLYDIRPDGRKEFLGAAAYNVAESEGIPTQVTFIPEDNYINVVKSTEKNRLYEEIVPIASGSWSILVVPVDDSYDSENTLVIFGGVMLFVASIGIAIWMYTNMKRVVDIYKAKAEAEAERTIVANLFPENVRERLLRGAEVQNARAKDHARLRQFGARTDRGSQDPLSSEGLFGSKPIADFHPEASLLFADLKGFTAWSSVREPSQVFTLLEVLFSSFDRIAKRRKVYKVETVGDCYVASAGVPIPLKDHAVVMARFAMDCLKAMPVIVHKLETTLGPDTGDLGIRIGIHSGAVTSGVLRGDKGRFQIFGDTMNTASRMESTGMTGRIQVSPETAEYLRAAGKGNWLEPRDVKVFVKGKGHLQTYWLSKNEEARSQASSNDYIVSDPLAGTETCVSKTSRLVSWNTEEMTKLLKQVVARRKARSLRDLAKKGSKGRERRNSNDEHEMLSFARPLDEVKDVVILPEFDAEIQAFQKQVPPESIEFSSKVTNQLTDFVTRIAKLYHSNPFHNFEHASHVAMSVTKLLARIVASSQPAEPIPTSKDGLFALDSLDHSFGITSDPLTQFAAFFSALIHDVDHPGVPNVSLAKEKPELAEIYRNKSIAEQNSIDLAWALLMSDEFKDLRLCICANDEELKHFRQLVVQMVMSTDVMDKEIGLLRKERWNIAFAENADDSNGGNSVPKRVALEVRNRKATIVIEHLIQASDVSHTMQHWHIYRKWNECLFMEMYHAYKLGRLASDPSEGWYEGELGFLDYYVLPLAKKLDTCGVFGVSSDEFRIYATENRREFELKGKSLVQEYLAKYNETMDESTRYNVRPGAKRRGSMG